MQGEHLGNRQQVLQALVVGRPGLGLGRQAAQVVVMDLHAQAGDPARHGLPDPAHADDAQAFSGHLRADHEGRAPGLRRACADQALALAGAPRRASTLGGSLRPTTTIGFSAMCGSLVLGLPGAGFGPAPGGF